MILRALLFFFLLVVLTTFGNPAVFARDTDGAKAPLDFKFDPAQKVFNAKRYTLDNGLEIVVVENHRAPVVTHMVWYRVGAADEPRGTSGIAHFLEHLLFKGQKSELLGDIPPGEFSKTVRRLGGKDNAFTSQDYTAFYQSIASDQLETVMTMEAGRMRGLAPTLEEVASENKVIQEERRQRTDNDPRAKMQEQLSYALYPNHPYGIPVIGWMHEMTALTWEDAKSFYDTWYVPNNAILIVSGDVTGEEVLALAKKTYGLLPASPPVPERMRPMMPDSFVARTDITLEHADIREESFMRGYRATSYRQNRADALALEVLGEIVGGGPTSRLYKQLVVEEKLASSVSLSYSPNAYDDSDVWISGTPAQGHTMAELEAGVDRVLRDLIRDGVGEQELSEAVTRMKDAAVYALDSLSGPAMIIGYNLVTGSSLDDIEYWPQYIQQVSAAQVQDVARRFLNPDEDGLIPPVTGYFLPKAPHAPEGQNEEAAP